jgi:ankyrin repeat protein
MIDQLIKTNKKWLLNEKKMHDDFNALHLACLNNHFEIVKMLIEIGNVPINEQNLNKQTPLLLCVTKRNFQIAEYLLERKNDELIIDHQDKDGETALHYSLRAYLNRMTETDQV